MKKNIDSIFNIIPIRLDILDINLNIKQKIYLLGEENKSNENIIEKEGINSNKIKNIKFNEELIKGGVVDWEDLEDEDFETIINTEIVSDDTKINEVEDVENVVLSDIYDYSINIYKEDSIFELQKKIALITKIEPIKQYLSIDRKCLTHYINFQSILDGSYVDNVDLIDFLKNNNTKIKNIPVDEEYINLKYNSNLVNTQYVKLNTFLNNDDGVVIKLISIDTIISNKNNIQFLLRTDKQSFDLIFESIIERFFIMMNSQVFNHYLNSNDSIFDFDNYKSVIKNQNKIITSLNEIPKVSIEDKILTIITNSITLRSKSNYIPVLVLPKLFNSFKLKDLDNVFYVDLFITNDNKLLQIRKVSKYASQSINLIEGVSMNIKPLVSNIREYRTRNRFVISLLPSEHFSKISINIDNYGQIEINADSNRSNELSKSLFIKQIKLYITNIIQYLNNLTNIYLTNLRLDDSIENYIISKSTSMLMFNQKLDYDKLVKYMLSDLSATDILDVESLINVNLKIRTFRVYGKNIDDIKSIQVYSNSKLAVFTLIDLDIEETKFYVDLIGRFILYRENSIVIKINETKGIQSIDPILYRYKSSSKNNYSRVCQKRFQPVLTDSKDKSGYKYHNFTFNIPQYYKCPSKENPHLGLISGHHPNGLCLPCCRKQEQPNKENVFKQCISGDIDDDSKYTLTRTSNKYYVIDYPNDLISNKKMLNRFINVPNFINKILTKGNKLIINGSFITYDESLMNYQVLNILTKYLNKSSSRLFILDILEFLNDKSNHRKVLSMYNIKFSFDSIESLKSEISNNFLKQSLIKKSILNWNEIIMDISICMGIGIVLLSDNRIKASNCEYAVNKNNECSNEPITTLNASIKLVNLEYVDLNNPAIMILRRIDTEYSKIHNNRRYYYYIITTNIENNSIIEVIKNDTIDQLKKIKNITQESINNVIDNSFNYKTLNESINKIGSIKNLFLDSDNNIAYSEVVIKPLKTLLISLYKTFNELDELETKKLISKYKLSNYTGTISDVINLIETHNKLQLSESPYNDLTDFKLYINLNINSLINHKEINLPDSKKYLLKIDKFIIHSNTIIGVKVCIVNKKKIIHSINIYHKHTSIKDVIKLLKSKLLEVDNIYNKKKLTNDDYLFIAIVGLDMINRSNSIIYNKDLLKDIGDEFKYYFIEYFLNPLTLINNNPEIINYPENDTLKKSQYMNNIYKLSINSMVNYWKTKKPTEFIKALTKLIDNTSDNILKVMSNNLIEDWIDKLIIQFSDKYNSNVIRVELNEFSSYIHKNLRTKTKSNIIDILNSPDITLNNIELHNLVYIDKSMIKKLVLETANECLVKTKNIPEIEPENIDNLYEQYKDKNGKLLIYNSIYNDLIDLIVSELSNPFRREFVLDNCMINSFVNKIKIKSYIDELIYIQEL